MFLQGIDCDIACYADDNTSYTSNYNLDTILTNCQNAAKFCVSGLKWFDKCPLLVTTDDPVSKKMIA